MNSVRKLTYRIWIALGLRCIPQSAWKKTWNTQRKMEESLVNWTKRISDDMCVLNCRGPLTDDHSEWIECSNSLTLIFLTINLSTNKHKHVSKRWMAADSTVTDTTARSHGPFTFKVLSNSIIACIAPSFVLSHSFSSYWFILFML